MCVSNLSYRLQKLRPEHADLLPLLDEVALLLPGNEFDRIRSRLQLEDALHSSPGLMLTQEERVIAVMLYTIKGSSCRISFAYALKEEEPVEMLCHLFHGLISLAKADKQIASLRLDVVPWFPLAVEQALQLCGFTRVERLVMRRSNSYPRMVANFPPGYRLVPWEGGLNAAAEILHRSFGTTFEGSWDRNLTELDGCRLFMADCYSGRYGNFDDRISFALQYENYWAGMALATWSSDGEGFIPAFGLLPNFTGKGLGSTMLAHLLQRYGQAAFPPPAIELAVSAANTAAVGLYGKYGFKERSYFSVYYLDM